MRNAFFRAPGIHLELRRWLPKGLCGVFLGFFLLTMAWAASPRQARNSLQIYFVDVEGGQATLFVTPGGQSLLIDTGWPGNNGRNPAPILPAPQHTAHSHINFSSPPR